MCCVLHAFWYWLVFIYFFCLSHFCFVFSPPSVCLFLQCFIEETMGVWSTCWGPCSSFSITLCISLWDLSIARWLQLLISCSQEFNSHFQCYFASCFSFVERPLLIICVDKISRFTFTQVSAVLGFFNVLNSSHYIVLTFGAKANQYHRFECLKEREFIISPSKQVFPICLFFINLPSF